MAPQFIHLHLHTEYSIRDGLITIESLMESVLQTGMPAVAMTDQCNLFAMVKFYQAGIAAGLKPIIGVDLQLPHEHPGQSPYHLLLLCQNQHGYRNLTRLISRAYLEGQTQGVPLIHKAWLTGTTDGLIALSGGREGDIGQALLTHNPTLAAQRLTEYCQWFPNRFYLELQRTGREFEEDYLQAALDLAQQHQVPVVATNDVRFLATDDFEAHEARVCIQESYTLNDAKRPKRYSQQQYLRTPQEMEELFADIPEALQNSVEIAKRCNLELTLDQPFLPNFPVPAGMTIDNYFDNAAQQGLTQRLTHLLKVYDPNGNNQQQIYKERLHMELDIIKRMGFPGYFLIVADFIRWAKDQHIPVGPGRGSGVGSLVAYALGITDLDPITHELLFERFLNPERVSMPDFDIDFCMEGRDRVIEYVAQKYGRESVAQIITYGTMAARAVVRDVGRVLGYPYGFVDKIAKLIPFELGMTLKKALQQDEQLLKRYQEEEEVKTLIDLAKKLEGITRNAGKHAGGVVIAPSVLTDFTPLYCEEGSSHIVTQFDKDDVEAIGLVKFDFLGLRTLTIIDWAVQTINQKRQQNNEVLLDIIQLPLDDKKTFELLCACRTAAIFQFESRGMKDLIRRLQPNCFNEIVDLGAMFRPGPLQSGMMDDFINRKHGRAAVIYPHPALEPILRPTYGVMLYQEQVMQIAQVLAGYSLGKADLLRRAMGKKMPEEMAKQRAIFVAGAKQRGVKPDVAEHIFDLMEKFSGYGFNKSHSAAYALITYQTAWLKAHYPAEFMAAVLSSDMDHTDKVVIFIEECKQLGLKLLSPDINCSVYKFTVTPQGEIVYGLGAIKGVGAAAVEQIILERQKNGTFCDLFEFCHRLDGRKVNRRVLESLIRAGAMDSFNVERATLMASLDKALQAAEQQARQSNVGQVDLFGTVLVQQDAQQCLAPVTVKPWTEQERLLGEKETLGLYLSGHPITRYENELKQFITARIVDLKPERNQTVIVAGFVVAIKTLNTRSGNRIAFLTLDDRTARIELAVFSEVYAQSRELLVKDQLLVVEGEVATDEFTGSYRLSGRRLLNWQQAREYFAKGLLLQLNAKHLITNFSAQLKQLLMPFRGGRCVVCIDYQRDNAKARLILPEEWYIRPDDNLLKTLAEQLGEDNVVLRY
ncbi:MAG: DNA polymerase III subunit alpha [Gammaproteobacteria bacterium]